MPPSFRVADSRSSGSMNAYTSTPPRMATLWKYHASASPTMMIRAFMTASPFSFQLEKHVVVEHQEECRPEAVEEDHEVDENLMVLSLAMPLICASVMGFT